MKLSSTVVGDFINEISFSNKFLLSNTQVSRLLEDFENVSSANIKLLKTYLHKIEQWGGFLGRLLGSLPKTELPLMNNILKPLAKTAVAVAAVHTKMFGLDRPGMLALPPLHLASSMTTLIISNEEMNAIMKTAKPFE